MFLFLHYLHLAPAHKAYGIKKSHAFHREQLPGTIKSPEEGEPKIPKSDTLHIIYFETKGPTAIWESAWWHDKTYSVSANLISANKEIAGRDFLSGKPITVSASKGIQLWVPYLNSADQATLLPVLKK